VFFYFIRLMKVLVYIKGVEREVGDWGREDYRREIMEKCECIS